MALQSQLNFPIKKCTKGSAKISCDSPKQLASAKRALFEEISSSPKKRSKQDENSNKRTLSAKPRNVQNTSSLAAARHLFHTSQPAKIIGRSKEISEIENFLNKHISKRQAASLYISGPPGTGKTICLMSIIEKMQKEISFAFVNCMDVSNPNDIYASIAREFKVPKALQSKNLVKCLEKYVLTSTSMNVLVLDEIDNLDSKGQEVLYALFQWPQLPGSSLILIGIANTLDLTDRLLPRLHTFNYDPTLLQFQPYSKEQIIEILEDRLSSVENGNCPVVKPVALQLCARKIAAHTGDIRTALGVCCRAIDKVQIKRNAKTLQSTSDDRSNPGSPMKGTAGLCVDVSDVNSVLNEVYGSRLQTSDTSKSVTIPLQQMVILCTLILMKNHCKNQDMTVGKLHDIYKRVCKKRDINSVTEWEFNGLCKLIATRGFISLKSAKAFRMTKIVLKIDKAEAESLLQDKALLSSILSDKSVLNKN